VPLRAGKRRMLQCDVQATPMNSCRPPHRVRVVPCDQGRLLAQKLTMAATGGTGYQGTKKETVLDLSKYIDKSVRVKLAGGREGTLWERIVAARCSLMS
jgi:hypothetical protein